MKENKCPKCGNKLKLTVASKLSDKLPKVWKCGCGLYATEHTDSNNTVKKDTKKWDIGDEVIVLRDIHGTGLFDIERIGTVVATADFYVKVKGFVFSKWYPLNNYYLVCKIIK